MKLTKEAIAKMSQSYSKAKTQHVAENAVTKNGILAASENSQVAKDLSTPAFAFSIDVDSQAVANQKQSGRCWMFACLNFCRFHVEKTLDLPQGTFELWPSTTSSSAPIGSWSMWQPLRASLSMTVRSPGSLVPLCRTAATGTWSAALSRSTA